MTIPKEALMDDRPVLQIQGKVEFMMRQLILLSSTIALSLTIGCQRPAKVLDQGGTANPTTPSTSEDGRVSDQQTVNALAKEGFLVTLAGHSGPKSVTVRLRDDSLVERGKLKEKLLAGLKKLTEQTYVEVNAKGFSDEGLAELSGVPAIKGLTITGSPKLKNLSPLGSMSRLTYVWLEDVPIESATLASFAKLQGMTHLTLINTTITDEGMSHFGKLGAMQSLRVGGADITTVGLSQIKGMSNLEQLELNDCPMLKGDSLEHLANLRKLTILKLTKTGTTDDALKHVDRFEKLYSLDLSQTAITDKGLENLKSLKELANLDLSHTAVTDKGLEALVPVKSLRILDLSETGVTDKGLENLAKLEELTLINLRKTAVTEAGAVSLRKALPKAAVRQ
jgi:internalin A